MPLFIYTALSENGRLTTGEAAAVDAAALAQELGHKGLRIQNIRSKRSRFGLTWFARKRIKPEVFMLFNQEFTALIRAGLTIPDALKLSADRPEHPALASVLQQVLAAVRGGSLFSEACAHHPDTFDGLYLSALKTGEKTGGLVSVLGKYQESLKNRVAFDKKISHAMAYPLFLLATLAIILAVLFVFVMPRFAAMYADFGAELPFATKMLVNFVRYLYLYIPAIAALAIVIWFAWRRFAATDAGRLWIDTAKGRLPVLGRINRDISLTQLARSLATLLSGGTPLVEAMRTTRDSLRNRADALRLAAATQSVIEGKSLAEAMRQTNLMPNTALKMIEVGEASGNLDNMLSEIAQYAEEVLANKLARAMTLIEPLMMLLMGITIGGIIVVMYLPIFYLADIVK